VRFLADENCDFAIVRALRSVGYDVLAVSEFQQRSVDRQLMEMAYAEKRILLTEDKDFGWLAFVAHVDNPGVVLIRFPAGARNALASSITRLVSELGDKLAGAFVVLRPGSVRISNIAETGHD
jgi:predicted nuclease of predicted toxin-antitoxin system